MSVRHLPDTATSARLSGTRLPSRPRATMAANTFAPYVCSHFHPDSAYHSTDLQSPPQDDPAHRQRIWFAHSSASYQSGASPASASASPDIIERGPHHDWQTTYGMRVDVLSAFAYLLGPISGSALSFSSRVLPSQLGIQPSSCLSWKHTTTTFVSMVSWYRHCWMCSEYDRMQHTKRHS